MNLRDYDKIVETWKRIILVEILQDFNLEVDKDIPKEHAAITLYLDYMTVKASGEIMDVYEGYKKAATDVLNLIGVEMVEDYEMKVILLKKKISEDYKQELLKKYIWE